ncbi:MAG TPA: hypothetical protein VFT79_10930 [Solirubrobacterales bacterium]|nr:hypothetical protein [Solirubrobacterales bacterium]
MGMIAALGDRVVALVRARPIDPSGPMPDIPRDDLPESTNPKTVEALLDNLRRLVAYEEQRLSSLTTRGAALAGFAGVGTVVIAADDQEHLPVVAKVLLVLAAAGLVFTAAAIVLGVLSTWRATIQSTRQVSLYREPGYRTVSPARVQVQMIDVLIPRLEALRAQNHERATWLNRASLALVVAVFLASVAGAIRLFA